MADVKFSQFTDGNNAEIGDTVVGLRSGTNYRFDFPGDGIKDGNGNYLFKYATTGAGATNYLQFTNGQSGTPTQIETLGDDANVDLTIATKGAGKVNIPAEVDQLQKLDVDNIEIDGNNIISTDTAGDINLTPDTTGDLVLDGLKWPQADGAANTFLYTTGSAQLAWSTTTFPTAPGTLNSLLRSDGSNWVETTTVTIDATDVASGFTQLNVDNLRLDGNDLSSQNTDGNITFTPNGTGVTQTAKAIRIAADSTVLSFGAGNDATLQYNGTDLLIDTQVVGSGNLKFTAGNIDLNSNSVDNGALGANTAITSAQIDNININGNAIISTDAAGDITITPDTTGSIVLDGLSWPQADGSANQHLKTNGAAQVGFTTATYADTYGASELLYSNGANTVAGLATVNNAALSTNASGVPTWLALADGQIVIGSSAGAPAAATLTAGTGITITNGNNTITIDSSGGFTWNEVTGLSASMAVNNGYIANNAAQVDLPLPATAALGDVVLVQGKGAGGWKISQNAGQTIHFGSSDTTTGVAGSLESTQRYDSIELVCITANTDWAVLTSPMGTLTVN